MKSMNLFAKIFAGTALVTFASLALASYSAKKALAADPELLNRLQNKYNIKITGFSVTPSQAEMKNDWNIPGPVKNIKLASVSGELRIMSSTDGNLSIEAKGRLPLNADPNAKVLKVEIQGTEISIKDEEDVKDLSILIKIPQDVDNLSLSGVSGDVSIKNANANNLNFKSVSGDLVTENSDFNTVKTETVSGDIEASLLKPPTGSFESISGDVKLKFPASKKIKFNLKTLSGKIETNHPSAEEASEKIDVKTTSGDIEIE